MDTVSIIRGYGKVKKSNKSKKNNDVDELIEIERELDFYHDERKQAAKTAADSPLSSPTPLALSLNISPTKKTKKKNRIRKIKRKIKSQSKET